MNPDEVIDLTGYKGNFSKPSDREKGRNKEIWE
jgi:hypothetical protein